ncbi:MAG: ATP-binding cassette domain-containing protein [Dehalococcoidales bacterium]|nr:ATP-binding cassette domain-containing protein [Dehalococcoidales bacterium]
MPAVEVNHIAKSFAGKAAVKDLLFSVDQGEVFGLIGPNGAGKTTTIRMMMDIIKPDSGFITILGQKLGEGTKNRLGYLPEERGLYRKMKVIDSLIYLSSLKGVDRKTAIARSDEYLDRTGLSSSKNKKIEELSKGMGQIIQFILTILHKPQLIILDEPFSGLDPVNTELLKSMLMELRNQGNALILSTHQMSQVEELCDRVLMVDNGSAVLYGGLREIKAGYRQNTVILDIEGQPVDLPGTTSRRTQQGLLELTLDENTTPRQILAELYSRGLQINRFEIATPSLNEIFLKVAGNRHEQDISDI